MIFFHKTVKYKFCLQDLERLRTDRLKQIKSSVVQVNFAL
jgi:hypothetical protein